ncbi:unnamed protein product [Clonostachys rosea f. rosea IK726]|uniref:Zn(2)-C6 fungal-type domain-containing protein n=2 Tax=Bionectria ochroleuca TaxID=29856 RepID=A0A0B7KNV6_BIOOC|nr:unnamed protein product [Clonostachys rosea f. rosea IK726]
MPRGPKSAGCQPCKTRKIKCDEKWPTCGNCLRSQRTCPGPSATLIFVSHRRATKVPASQPSEVQPLDGNMKHRPRKLQSWTKLATYGKGDGVEGVFFPATPRANLMARSDRVASQLAHFLTWGYDTVLCLQMSYLLYLPQRLSQSECLLNTTSLFCYAWDEYRHRRSPQSLFSTSLYGKTIRSLQREISGSEVCTVDTLAAMQMLERITISFGTKEILDNMSSHYSALNWVLANKAPPDPDDKFDILLAREGLNIIESVSASGDGSFTQSPWQGYADETHYDYLTSEEIKGFSESTVTFSSFLTQLVEWTHTVRIIQARPHENRKLKARLLQQIEKYDHSIEKIIDDSIQAALYGGNMQAILDPECITGIRYEFRSVAFATGLAGLLSFRANILQIVYDINALYETNISKDYENYRAVCMELWKFIPYATSLGYLSIRLTGCIVQTVEAMNEDERSYLLDNLERVDTSKKVVGGKNCMAKMGMAVAMIRTGRS